ncbi:hypothetical protein [Luteibacter sp. SG786]|nr:hypothetical protein [Luteibacter sp. SG786]NII52729.1 hypothetical protein [Luteibacter sp. SG786]
MIVKLTQLQLKVLSESPETAHLPLRYESNAIGMAMEDLIDKLFQ